MDSKKLILRLYTLMPVRQIRKVLVLSAACLFISTCLTLPKVAIAGRDTTIVKGQVVTPQIPEPNQTILDYENFLAKDTEAHRQLVENFLNMVLIVLGVALTAVVGIIAWAARSARKEIKGEIKALFSREIRDLVNREYESQYGALAENFKSMQKTFGFLMLDVTRVMSNTANTYDIRQLKGKKILWVDDHPERHRDQEQVLRAVEIDITISTSTTEAIELLQKNKYDLVISNMGREEDIVVGRKKIKKSVNPRAGLDLLQAMKEKRVNVPLVFFTRPECVQKYGELAREQGASIVTGYYQILNEIQKRFIL